MREPDRSDLHRAVEQRAKGRCEYCQSPARYSTRTFSLEHIIPRRQGGDTSLDNLALACQGCHNHKYHKTKSSDPVTNRLVDLFHPRTQRWQAHFIWDARFERIIGLTATGRATVEAWQLNRPELVNLRRLLDAAGEHPLPDSEEAQEGQRHGHAQRGETAELIGEEGGQQPVYQPCMLQDLTPISPRSADRTHLQVDTRSP